ncbi:hypothetical protein SEVIR_2G016400v4 [Setaria viridis]|uniref:F-box domain-containing protein n=1 Tax=Setaria viridis TaxID=4556 RepID=A0A4U6VMS9_SETVI|nr:putative FBD-associated F-box protein At1g50980 [Setaria viridis]TKW30155.1 hypothetical protein SEVIR_2G016400v2 [Setaria viridis]
MAMPAGAKRERRARLDEDGKEELVDRISRLPDDVLGNIVSFLPTKDGARTQVLSSRWRPIWRSAPLNLEISIASVSRILSAHQGPGRRFCTQFPYLDPSDRSATLDRWLRSPALNSLQVLEFHLGSPLQNPPLPASVHRFSSTLRAASFGCCAFPEGNSASPLHLPLLKQLSLFDVRISETSFNALLAACPTLQSLLLTNISGCSRVQIVSQNLRSIGFLRTFYRDGHTSLQQLIIKDAPYLERLLCFENGSGMEVTVVSAPQLHVLALHSVYNLRHYVGSTTFLFGRTAFQRSCIPSSTTVVHSMKVLALTQPDLCLDMVINLLKCFPCLEKLYIETQKAGKKNTWCHKYKNLIGTLEIHLKKIVLTNYRGNTSHVNFAKFFVLNARMLQSMRFELFDQNPSTAWIEKQHGLLQIKKASRVIQFDFVAKNSCSLMLSIEFAGQVHDLLTADPFVKLHNWT